MKKTIIYVLALLVLVVGLTGCNKKEETKVVTLEELAEKFNNCETVKSYKEYGLDIKAEVKKDNANVLSITYATEEGNTSVEFTKDGNILKNDKMSSDDAILVVILTDAYGQLLGYKDKEVAENITAFSDEWEKYTVAKEGFEIKELDETKEEASFKLDLSKKLPLLDMKNFYIKPSEFDMIKQFVDEKQSGNQSGVIATIAYNLQVMDKENEIIIGEKDKLTDSAYKSILSGLEVMYGKETADKFKSLYPSFKTEKTVVGAFTIDTTYTEEDSEMYEGMKLVKVTIDNKKVNK